MRFRVVEELDQIQEIGPSYKAKLYSLARFLMKILGESLKWNYTEANP